LKFVLDVCGTLQGNPVLTDEDIRRGLLRLKNEGHYIILHTALPEKVSQGLRNLADEVRKKNGKIIEDFDVSKDTVVVDDEAMILRCYARKGAKILSAEQFGLWLSTGEPLQ
jgi:hypothetical protein